MLIDLLKEAVITRVSNAVAAGTTEVDCTSVDMRATPGFDTVTFIAFIGTLTATQVTNLKLQYSDDNSAWTDVPSGGTAAMADADSNKMLIATYKKPLHRYIRVAVVRGTANAVVDGVVALQYNAKQVNTTQGTGVSASIAV